MIKTMLVTGAGGFVGPRVVTALLDRGLRVIAADRSPIQLDSRAEVLVDDFENLPARLATAGPLPDVVLHLAWQDGFQHDAYSHIDLLPKHFRFLAEILRLGVRHVAAMGSMHEVGYWEGSIDEATPTNPGSLYGVAKNAVRQLLLLEAKKTGATAQWLRGFYIIADDNRGQSLFSKIRRWEDEGLESFPFNSGANQYDFIGLDEFAEQVAAVVDQTAVTGVINCCSGEPRPLRDAVESFIARHGLKIRPAFGKFPDRAYDSPITWGDAARVRSILRSRQPAQLQPGEGRMS